MAALCLMLCSFSPATGDNNAKIILIAGGIVLLIIIVAVVLGRKKYK